MRFAVAGSESVMLFFVLSGFVLSLPFYSNQQPKYGQYIIKRTCRIYIPYIVAIFLAILLEQIMYKGSIPALTQWFNINWSSPVTKGVIIKHLLLIDSFMSNINNVVWSLVHEMRISIVFPIIMVILLRLNWKQSIFFCFALSVASVIYVGNTKAHFFGTEFYSTFHYSSLFIFGALLAKYRNNIIEWLQNLDLKLKGLLFILGIIMFLYAHPSFVLNIVYPSINPYYRTVLDSWFIAAGACILIAFAISPGVFSKLLNHKFVVYLGKISYSLYLCHLAILLSLIHWLYNKLPIGIICIMTVLCAFLISSLFHYLIEKPAITLGKYLTKSTNKSKSTQNKKASA